MLGSLILYLKGMRIMTFQLSGFYCSRYCLLCFVLRVWGFWNERAWFMHSIFSLLPSKDEARIHALYLRSHNSDMPGEGLNTR